MYAQWIQSYRDLPLLINQWCNVVRWELRTRLFLRTMEFLWQEGHTAHATAEEAEEETLRMLGVYADFAETDAAVPVVQGRKSESEKFAGAVHSYTIEAMMGNKWALQAGTSHFLGQNFAKAFNIQFLNQNNELEYCWTTSWGLSTRFVGAIIMVHGDDQGLKLPPKLAPIKVVAVPIYRSDEEKAQVMAAVRSIEETLKDSFRVKVDDREGITPGFKFNDWEMRGVPVRIEVGPRDVAANQVTLARRDIPGREGKLVVSREALIERLSALLEEVQANLFAQAKAFLDENSYRTDDYDEFKEILATKGGFIYSRWCGNAACEARVKEETKATIRCIPFDQPGGEGPCLVCGEKSAEVALFARAY
jgi:prolyl-tRNA synthetase